MKRAFDAPRSRERVVACSAWTGLVAAVLLTSGCSQLYLHYDGYEKATAEVKADVEKIDVVTAFNSLAADAEELAKREDEALAAAQIGLRDDNLSKLIDPIPGDWLDPSKDARGKLQYVATIRFEDLLGGRDALRDAIKTDKPLKDFYDFHYRNGAGSLRGLLKLVDSTAAAVEQQIRLYTVQFADAETTSPGEAPKPVVFTCAWAAKAPPPDAELKEAHKSLQDLCGQQKVAQDNLTAFLCQLAFKLKPTGMCDPNMAHDTGALKDSRTGTIANAALELLAASSSIKRLTEEAEKIKKEAAELAKKLEVPGDPQALQAALKAFDEQLAKAGAFAKLAGLDLIQSFLECGFIADLRAAAEAGASEAGASSETPNAACTSGKKASDSEGAEGKFNGGLTLAIKSLLRLQEDQRALERLERIDANLMTLSALKLRRDLALAQVDLDKTKLNLYRGRLLALLTEYGNLDAMEDALPGVPAANISLAQIRATGSAEEKDAVALALAHYTAAWNYGVVPADLIRLRYLHANRKYRIQVAAVNGANYKATVQPIVDALAIYGAGGITPEMIVQWLQFLGIAKIAAGI